MAGAPTVLNMGLNTQRTLKIDTSGTVRFSNPTVATLSVVEPGVVLVTGIGEGRGEVVQTLDGGVRRWPVRVRKVDLGHRLVDLSEFFPCGSTLEVRVIGNRVYLDGEASSLDEWRAAVAVTDKWPSVVVLGHLKKDVVELVFAEAQLALKDAGLLRARWVRAGEVALLEGSTEEHQVEKLRALADDWRPKLTLALTKPKRAKPE